MTQAVNDPQVAAIIGPLGSAVAEQEIPVTNQAGIALISPSTTYSCLTKNSSSDACSTSYDLEPTGQTTFFRLPAPDTIQAVKEADFLHPMYQTVYLIQDSDPKNVYSRGFADIFLQEWQKDGGSVIKAPVPYATPNQDYRNLLSSLQSPYPNLIFYSGSAPDATTMRETMLSMPNLQSIAFAGNDGIVTPSFAGGVLPSPTGVGPTYATVPVLDPLQTSTGRSIRSSLIDQANTSKFRAYTASAYDCTKIVLEAISQVIAHNIVPSDNSFRQAIIKAIQSIKYTNNGNGGATGNYEFKANGDSNNTTVSLYELGQTDWEFKKPLP